MRFSNAEERARHAALSQRLSELGWTDGRNVRIDTRWVAGNERSEISSLGDALRPSLFVSRVAAAVGLLLLYSSVPGK
jgi:hypothetical protein